MQMWKNYKEFKLTVKSSWELHLSKKISYPIPGGQYNGRISKDVSGFEIRKDEKFITSRPLYVYRDDPHEDLFSLWSVKQEIQDRGDCGGYAPKKLVWETGYEDDSYIKLPNNGGKCPVSDCMYLGSNIPVKFRVEIREIFRKELYSVHRIGCDNILGYMITVGIWGPDISRFHSDDGYYEVAVTLPCAYAGGVDFIAMLGQQNALQLYELDPFDGLVDWEDLEWFDQVAEKYLKKPCPNYSNIRGPGGSISMSTSLDAGIYRIESQTVKTSHKSYDLMYKSFDCGRKGEDNQGNKYTFPYNNFKLKIIKSQDEMKIYKDFMIELPEGGYMSVFCGNLEIQPKSDTKRDQTKWNSDTFRMYTDLNRIGCGRHWCGDMSEYDQDPEKTMMKMEAAMKKSIEGYYSLPPREGCCDDCENTLIHRRCPKQIIKSTAIHRHCPKHLRNVDTKFSN